MLECMILGDSIAKGVGMVRQDCMTFAASGINSQNYVKQYVDVVDTYKIKTAIISLGANDYETLPTEHYLTQLRSSIDAQRVFWIVPNNHDRTARQDVINIAKRYGDFIIDTRKHELSPDKVHPTGNGYRDIAAETRGQ